MNQGEDHDPPSRHPQGRPRWISRSYPFGQGRGDQCANGQHSNPISPSHPVRNVDHQGARVNAEYQSQQEGGAAGTPSVIR